MKQKSKELPNFPFPLFLESGELEDRELKQKLPLELFLKHEGYEVTIKQKRYVLSISSYSNSQKDTLELEISTWKGVSVGAIHFYGHLKIPNIEFEECGTGTIHMGYGIPNVLNSIELHRPLTKKELLEDKDRYKGYNIGDMVPGFNTEEDVVKRARVVAKKHFPGFKLKIPRI